MFWPIALTIVCAVILLAAILIAIFVITGWIRWASIGLGVVAVLVFFFVVLPMYHAETLPAAVTPAGIPVATKVDVTINGCVTESVGVHPNSGEPFIFKADPYPGVLCEYELFYQDKTTRIIMPAGQASLVQDWAVTCPTGPACEGTWVATGTIEVPAGWLVHMWVYSSGYSAAARFPSFACEYLAYGNKGHTNANIRTAPWALESGSGSTLDVPACVGFAGVPGK